MLKMNRITILFVCALITYVQDVQSHNNTASSSIIETIQESIGCICGIFLSGSLKKGTNEQPGDNVTLIHKPLAKFPCSSVGNRLCIRHCLNIVAKNVHNSTELICDALGRDSYREKAYLFIKNCKDKWINTNLSGPRQYCCKNGLPYKCSSY